MIPTPQPEPLGQHLDNRICTTNVKLPQSLTYHRVDGPIVVAPLLVAALPAFRIEVASCRKDFDPGGEGGFVLLVMVGRGASEASKWVLLFASLLVAGVVTIRVLVATKISVEANFGVGLFTLIPLSTCTFFFSERGDLVADCEKSV